MGANGRVPAGGRLLGAPQQVAITEQQVVPLLYIEVVDNVAGIAAAETVLRVINPLSGLAVFCPISPQGVDNLIRILAPHGATAINGGGADGESTVHE